MLQLRCFAREGQPKVLRKVVVPSGDHIQAVQDVCRQFCQARNDSRCMHKIPSMEIHLPMGLCVHLQYF